MGELSANGKKVLSGAIELIATLKRESELGIENTRPTYYEIGIEYRSNKSMLLQSTKHPPIPDHIQKERDDRFKEYFRSINKDNNHFDPYQDIPELPMGGRKVGD